MSKIIRYQTNQVKNRYIGRIINTNKHKTRTINIRKKNIQFWYKAADAAVAGSVALAALCIYTATLAPTIVAADAGELVTAAYELGVAHPPGYPLWCILAHLFIKIFASIQDVAYRVNLLSAFAGAFTCSFVYLIARQLKISIAPAAAAALLLAASREIWAQSVIAEVYTLNSAFFTALLLCIIRWDITRKKYILLIFSLLLGLGLTNHHTIAVLGPAAVIFVLARNWKIILDYKLIAAVTALFVVGLSVYLYLPLRAAAMPYMDWGHPETISRLWAHVTRAQYKVNYTPLPRTPLSFFFQISVLMRYYLEQFSPLIGFTALILVPFAVYVRKNACWILVFSLFLLTSVVYIFLVNTKFSRQDIEAQKVFFIPAYSCAAVLIAAALQFANNKIIQILRQFMKHAPACLLGTALLLMPALISFGHNYKANDFSDYWYADDHAQNIFVTMKPNAVIFPSGDHNTFPLIYLHKVEQVRPDITIADKYGYVEARDFPRLQPLENDKTRLPRDPTIRYILTETDRPVYFTVKYNVPTGLKVQQIRTGLLYEVSAKPNKDDPENIWTRYRYRNINHGFQNPPDYGAVNIVSDYYYFYAQKMLSNGNPSQSLTLFARCANVAHGIKEVYNNIASALAEHGLLEHARRYYRNALKIDHEYTSALWNIARTCSALKDYEAAAQHFLRLRKIKPDDFRVPGELGFIYLRHLNNTKSAINYLNQSLQIKPDQKQITQTLDTLRSRRTLLRPQRKTHDFGKVLLRSENHTTFTVRNVSDKPLEIESVDSDCGCTIPKIAQKHLYPKQTTQINVSYRENKKLGKHAKHITVKTSEGRPLILTIKANVVPQYTTEPAKIELKELVPKSKSTHHIHVHSFNDRAFAIKSVLSSFEMLEPLTSPEFNEPSPSHKIKFNITTGLTTGKKTGKLTIFIKDQENPELNIPITIHIRHPVILEPRSFFLTSLLRGPEISRRIKINLPPNWTAKITKIKPSANWLYIHQPPRTLTESQTLIIKIKTDALPKTFSGSITIITDHPSIPSIVIPVYGYTE